WRDPTSGLLGIYGSYLWLDRGPWPYLGKGSGVAVAHVGPEVEMYWKNWTVRATTGWEGGDVHGGGFAKADLRWYPLADLMLSVGYRRTFQQDALALGAEFLVPQNFGPARVSLFAEGRFGNDDNRAVVGGLRVYFGPSKTLIDKHRRDDPGDWNNDNIFAAQKLANQFNLANDIAKCANTSCTSTIPHRRLKRDILRIGTFAEGIGH